MRVERAGGRGGEGGLDLGAERGLVGLDREQVVSALAGDRPGDLGVGGDGVDGDERALQPAPGAEPLEKRRNGGELANRATDAETRIQEVREAEATLQQQLVQAREKLDTMTRQRVGLEAAVAELSARREDLVADVSNSQAQRDSVQEELKGLSETLSARADNLAELETRISELQEQGAQAAAARIVGLSVGNYSAGSISAVFDEGGRFVLTSENGSEMSGQYTVTDDTLTFDGVENAAEGHVFPITCRISFLPTGFALAAPGDAEEDCGPLAGNSFVKR